MNAELLVSLFPTISLLASAVALGLSVYVARRKADMAGEPQDERSLPANPGGCTVNSHVWRKRPSLINDHEEIYYCARNCGSQLRHRFE